MRLCFAGSVFATNPEGELSYYLVCRSEWTRIRMVRSTIVIHPVATPKQTLLLVGLCIFLLGVTFTPTLTWLARALLRSTSVRTDLFQAEVPRGWVVRDEPSRLLAWRPCLTSFCSSPPASITIMKETFSVDTPIWMRSAETVL